MDTIAQSEKQYRRLSRGVIAVIVLFWAIITTWFIVGKIMIEYRQRMTVDYSVIFNQDGFNDFSRMNIYLDDKRLGYTQTIVKDIEGGGRLISGETSLTLKTPLISGVFRMESDVRINNKRTLDGFTMNIVLPIGTGQKVTVDGTVEAESLIITIPAFNYRDEIPLSQAIVSSGISPFSDMVVTTVGQEWEVQVFDPLTQRINRLKIKVVGKEDITWQGETASVYRLECRNPADAVVAIAWVDTFGSVLEQRIELFGMKLTLKKDE